ncbi:hypothetical protein C8R45DRAFT_1103420 [Mycena sanguinolenta]|nr:hypothetical protein C8R45DRAFT_1103420 [Mycena sanguinolenta]
MAAEMGHAPPDPPLSPDPRSARATYTPLNTPPCARCMHTPRSVYAPRHCALPGLPYTLRTA